MPLAQLYNLLRLNEGWTQKFKLSIQQRSAAGITAVEDFTGVIIAPKVLGKAFFDDCPSQGEGADMTAKNFSGAISGN